MAISIYLVLDRGVAFIHTTPELCLPLPMDTCWDVTANTTLYFATCVCSCESSWFKRMTPNSFRVQFPRRFSEIDPETLHKCLTCPCRAFYERFLFFFARYWGFCIFWDILGLKESNISSEKKNTHTHTQS